MRRLPYVKSIVAVAIGAIVVFAFQNCAPALLPMQFTEMNSEDLGLIPLSEVPAGIESKEKTLQVYRGKVSSDNELPQLKFFFVLDNSGTMAANNAQASEAVLSMFNNENSSNLLSFKSEVFVTSTAQNNEYIPERTTISGSYRFARGAELQEGYTGLEPNGALIERLRASKLSSRIPGDIFGFKFFSSETDDKKFLNVNIALAPVVGVKNGIASESVSSSSVDFLTELQERISVLNPEKRLQMYPLGSSDNQMLDAAVSKESGLCAMARTLKELKEGKSAKTPARFMASASEKPIFVLMSDENDAFADGKQCIDKAVYESGWSAYDCRMDMTRISSYKTIENTKNLCQFEYVGGLRLDGRIEYEATIISYDEKTLLYYKDVGEGAKEPVYGVQRMAISLPGPFTEECSLAGVQKKSPTLRFPNPVSNFECKTSTINAVAGRTNLGPNGGYGTSFSSGQPYGLVFNMHYATGSYYRNVILTREDVQKFADSNGGDCMNNPNFIKLVKQHVFGSADSPYEPYIKNIQCKVTEVIKYKASIEAPDATEASCRTVIQQKVDQTASGGMGYIWNATYLSVATNTTTSNVNTLSQEIYHTLGTRFTCDMTCAAYMDQSMRDSVICKDGTAVYNGTLGQWSEAKGYGVCGKNMGITYGGERSTFNRSDNFAAPGVTPVCPGKSTYKKVANSDFSQFKYKEYVTGNKVITSTLYDYQAGPYQVVSTSPNESLVDYIAKTAQELYKDSKNRPQFKFFVKRDASELKNEGSVGKVNSVGTAYLELAAKLNMVLPGSVKVESLKESEANATEDQKRAIASYYSLTFEDLAATIRKSIVRSFPLKNAADQFIAIEEKDIQGVCIKNAKDIQLKQEGRIAEVICNDLPRENWTLTDVVVEGVSIGKKLTVIDAVSITLGDEIEIKYLGF